MCSVRAAGDTHQTSSRVPVGNVEVFFIKVDYWCNIQKSVPYELIIEGDSIQFRPLRGDVTAQPLQ